MPMSNRGRQTGVYGVFFLAFAAMHCAPEDNSARERLCAGHGCTTECRELEVEACDIRDRDCQDVIFHSLQCVRGKVLERTPYIEIVDNLSSGKRNNPETLEDRPADVSPRAEGASTPTMVQAVSASTRNARALAERVFTYYINEGVRLLRFIPEPTTIDQAIDKEVEDIGAIESDGGVKVEAANADYRWLSMQLLAHEFVHAQQEASYGGIAHLFSLYPQTATSRQSVKAMIEGEAELYAWLTHAFMRKQWVDDWALLDYFEDLAKQRRRATASMPTPWTNAQSWLHYPVGARVLAERWLRGHNLAVQSVRHNLEPDFGAWARGFAQTSGAKLEVGTNCPPENTQMVVRDELGPSGLFALLVAATRDRNLKPIEPAWQVARALVDDQLEFFAPLLAGQQTQAGWLDARAKAQCEAEVLAPRDADEEQSQDDAGSDAGTDVAASSDAGDAGSAEIASADAGGEMPIEKNCDDLPVTDPGIEATEGVPYARLLPEGAVWLSWRLAFDTPDDAKAFVNYFEDVAWDKLEVKRKGAKVVVKGVRKPRSSEVHAAFDAWDAWAVCKIE